MATFLAGRNLAHGKIRTVVALAGICFSVTLLFMQLGFLASVSLTAMLVYDALDYDLVLTSPYYVRLIQSGTFPRGRLYQAQAHPEVAQAMPLYAAYQLWRNPVTRQRRPLVLLGLNPSLAATRNEDLVAQMKKLALPDTVLVDRLTRPDVGPIDVGLVTDVGARNLEVVGHFTVGPGFEAGLVVLSDQTFSQVFSGRSLDDVNVGLIKLRPGAEPDRVAEELRLRLPPDVRVFTRPQIAAHEQHFYVVNTSTGVIFGFGVLVALLFGVVIIYQVLSLEVTHRLGEYATLKAMGFSDRQLALIVLQQAFIFGVASYVPAYFFALGIYAASNRVTNLPVGMTGLRAAVVFVLTLSMCAFSGWMALRILRKADPVDLF